MRSKLQRSYNQSEIWLEQQMKSLWDLTRGEPLTLEKFTVFWLGKASMLQTSKFSDDWISILYQRVSYLIQNKTLLGSEDDKIHQAITILATASLLQQREVSDITSLLSTPSSDLSTIQDRFPIFYKGFEATKSRPTMESHVLTSGFDLNDTERAIDIIVIGQNGEDRDELHTYQGARSRPLVSSQAFYF